MLLQQVDSFNPEPEPPPPATGRLLTAASCSWWVVLALLTGIWTTAEVFLPQAWRFTLLELFVAALSHF